MKFYTDDRVINTFKTYIDILMTHVNSYTGLGYSEDPTIIGYETGNELNGIVWGDKDVPIEWIVEICSLIKGLDPKTSRIDETQGLEKPVVAGSLIWSLFGRNVPDCETYVPHSDGFTMHYGGPNNSAADNAQISTMRQHYFAMQGIIVDSYLPSVACSGNFIPEYDAEYTYV
ncbi:hypothetical protein DL95DRAFT_495856 [Leptodontidium sp. 2 PMI_412]|nr:hypothetical protein DL95DRAFT_495856 [Leptodontidium sp. 2 PMI_412]